MCILIKCGLWIALECAHPQHAGDHKTSLKRSIYFWSGRESPVYLECNAVVVGCCVWTAESHFLVFIQNEAGHSLSFVKSYLCEKGVSMFTQWARSQASAACFWSLPSFPILRALRWADRKSCQSGCQSFKGPIERAHKGSFVQHLDGEMPAASRQRRLGVCLHLTSPRHQRVDAEVFQPVSSPK